MRVTRTLTRSLRPQSRLQISRYHGQANAKHLAQHQAKLVEVGLETVADAAHGEEAAAMMEVGHLHCPMSILIFLYKPRIIRSNCE